MVNDKIVFDFMKKNYSIPAVEVLHVAAMNALCESQFGPFNNGGGTDITDPEHGGI